MCISNSKREASIRAEEPVAKRWKGPRIYAPPVGTFVAGQPFRSPPTGTAALAKPANCDATSAGQLKMATSTATNATPSIPLAPERPVPVPLNSDATNATQSNGAVQGSGGRCKLSHPLAPGRLAPMPLHPSATSSTDSSESALLFGQIHRRLLLRQNDRFPCG